MSSSIRRRHSVRRRRWGDFVGRSQGTLKRHGDHDWFGINLHTGRNRIAAKGKSLLDPHLLLREGGHLFLDGGSDRGADRGRFTLSSKRLTPAEAPPTAQPQRTFSRLDGYGRVNAEGAFESLLNRPLNNQAPLGGYFWNLDMIGAPEVWAANSNGPGATGKGVTIAVIDTGIDYNHREFKGRIRAGYDFVDGDSIAEDANGHGTHVAGTIAAARDGRGITGVAHDAKIMPIRVLDENGAGYLSDAIRAVRWATTQIMRDRVRREQGKYAAVDNFTSLDTGDHLFASVNFNDAPGSDQRGLLRTMLASNHFDYFELDQAIQLDVVNS